MGLPESTSSEGWRDYNARTVPPSTLPPLGAFGLLVMAGALVLLLGVLVAASFRINTAQQRNAVQRPLR